MIRSYARHYEDEATIPAPSEEVFAILDDHAKFSAHMSDPNWRTLWSSMTLTMDDERGRRVGSHIEIRSRILGLRLYVDEIVTKRDPPTLKEWQTTGTPFLLVIGHYRLRAEIHPRGAGSHVRVSIDYDLPTPGAWRGRMLGRMYAKWCVRQMTYALARQVPERRNAVGVVRGAA